MWAFCGSPTLNPWDEGAATILSAPTGPGAAWRWDGVTAARRSHRAAPAQVLGQPQSEGPQPEVARASAAGSFVCLAPSTGRCCLSQAEPPLSLFPAFPCPRPTCPRPIAQPHSLRQLPSHMLESALGRYWHQLHTQAAASPWGSGCPPGSAGDSAASGSWPDPWREPASSVHS